VLLLKGTEAVGYMMASTRDPVGTHPGAAVIRGYSSKPSVRFRRAAWRPAGCLGGLL